MREERNLRGRGGCKTSFFRGHLQRREQVRGQFFVELYVRVCRILLSCCGPDRHRLTMLWEQKCQKAAAMRSVNATAGRVDRVELRRRSHSLGNVELLCFVETRERERKRNYGKSSEDAFCEVDGV